MYLELGHLYVTLTDLGVRRCRLIHLLEECLIHLEAGQIAECRGIVEANLRAAAIFIAGLPN